MVRVVSAWPGRMPRAGEPDFWERMETWRRKVDRIFVTLVLVLVVVIVVAVLSGCSSTVDVKPGPTDGLCKVERSHSFLGLDYSSSEAMQSC